MVAILPMILRIRRRPASLPAPCLLALLLVTSCAGKTQTIGVSAALDTTTEAEPPGEGAPPEGDNATAFDEESDEPASEQKPLSEPGEEAPGSASSPEMEAELLRLDAQHHKLAELALHQSSGQENHLGLRIALSERAADLPWILAIRNDSPRAVELAMLPDLLRFDVGPTDGTTRVRCGGSDLPKKLTGDDTALLEPGQMLYYPFDPRQLCTEPDVLSAGSQVTVTYGFETQTKKQWKGGKMVEVEIPQTEPFVAQAKSQEGQAEIAGVKHLISSSFVLGATYPLDAVTVDNPATEGSLPRPPLTLKVSNLGTTSNPERGEIVSTVSNVSDRSITLLLRRENLTFEVVGQWSSTTCTMDPDDRAPDPAGFSTLAPGQSSTMVTRLAEACPPGTWRYPGGYTISAKFTSTVSGGEYGMNAYVGEFYSQRPATLFIPHRKHRPAMRVVR